MQAGKAYYSRNSFGNKLILVNKTATSVLLDNKLNAWKQLHEEIKDASGHRNALAHLPAVVEVNPDQSLSLMLTPHIYIPPSLRRNRNKKYDAGECERLAFSFSDLAERIDARDAP
jgi:hypothetical protein